ncbi:MAG: purine-binding chemotaxis protein CheW [Oscillospiraceae bacterium]|nr:purine-binding chemotaxis protein CheW [Oscillospiraceae bacterium]
MSNQTIPASEVQATASLPADENSELNNQLLTFRLEHQLYGVSICHVEQIISMQPVTEVPEYPSYAKGIVSLRGTIIPIIDLRLRLGRTETVYTERTCIVIINIGELQLGCIVDEVDAVVHISEDQIEPAPRMSETSAANRYLTGIARIPGENDGAKEKIVLCLDLTKILQKDEFEALAGAAV